MRPLRIGVLLPVSRMFPRLDHNFLAGLRAALGLGAVEHEMVIEPAGNAAVAPDVAQKVQRLLLQHRSDVIVGTVGAPLAGHVAPLLADARTPFIVSNLGADPMPRAAVNGYVFHNSFNLWKSAYALGAWAARHLGTRAGLAAGFHEAGYGIVPAFWSGFVEAGGGTVLATEITHRASSDEDASDAIARIADQQPDFIMGLYSGRSGVTFARGYAASRAASIPLLASGLLVQEPWLSEVGDGAVGIRSAFSFDEQARTPELEQFHRACGEAGCPEPNLFALLGYETGQVLAAAMAGSGTSEPSGETVARAVPAVTIASPRGPRRVDVETNELSTHDMLFEVRAGNGAPPRLERLGALELPGLFAAYAQQRRQQEDRPGWLNPYMVT